MVQAGERTGNAPLLPPFIAAATRRVSRGREGCAPPSRPETREQSRGGRKGRARKRSRLRCGLCRSFLLRRLGFRLGLALLDVRQLGLDVADARIEEAGKSGQRGED